MKKTFIALLILGGLLGSTLRSAPENPAASADAAADSSRTTGTMLHCGRLIRIERVTTPLPWIDMDKALAGGFFDAGTGAQLETQRPPAGGTVYAVVRFEVQKGRSLSPFDYIIRAGEKDCPCLGMQVGEKPCDPRRWRTTTPGPVALVFEVPADTETITLAPALDLDIPLRTLADIPFGTPVKPAAETGLAAPTTNLSAGPANADTASKSVTTAHATPASSPAKQPATANPTPKPDTTPAAKPKAKSGAAPAPDQDALDF